MGGRRNHQDYEQEWVAFLREHERVKLESPVTVNDPRPLGCEEYHLQC